MRSRTYACKSLNGECVAWHASVRRYMVPIPFYGKIHKLKQNVTNRRRLTFTIIPQESEKLYGNGVAEPVKRWWTFNQSYNRFLRAQAGWQRDRLQTQMNKRTETQTYYGLWWRRRRRWRQHKVDDAVDDVIHTRWALYYSVVRTYVVNMHTRRFDDYIIVTILLIVSCAHTLVTQAAEFCLLPRLFASRECGCEAATAAAAVTPYGKRHRIVGTPHASYKPNEKLNS